ncbi:MAG: ABC transporter ATP-binding protein [Saprospiraceae bacterium]|nr:ABC transporter ATP-binding protein [Lewinella sp.]
MISLTQVDKTYFGTGGQVHALKHTNLQIEQGEYVVVVGASGSGKSTLLNVIAGIDRPSNGDVRVAGQDLNVLNEGELAGWRGKHIGIVFQFYQLLPTLSARDNLLFAMDLVKKVPKPGRRAKAEHHLEAVGLADKMRKFPNELSGGERQRVAIARALANDPDIIIADEPTGNLDSRTSTQIHSLFQHLHELGTTLVMVTHANISFSAYDRVLSIQDGVLKALK